jgi:hypothetical protein
MIGAFVVCGAMLSAPPEARALDDAEPYARIIVDRTALRSGAGTSFRRVFVAHRGDVFPIRQRSTQDYWFQVELPDGTYAWVFGDAVYVHEVTEEEATQGRFLPQLFAPPPLMDANVEIAASFGVLGGGGFMALRPTILLAPQFGLEVTGAATVSKGGRILMGGAGGIVNLFPDFPIVPYAVVGGGIAASDPNADSFLLESGTVGMLYAGGGLRFGFRYRLTIRIEARAYAFFEPDRYKAQEEYSGGLTVFF